MAKEVGCEGTGAQSPDEASQRPARRGEHSEGMGHRRPRIPSERRSTGHDASTQAPSHGPDRPKTRGRLLSRTVQKDVRPLAPRGLRAAGRTARSRRGERVARDC